MKNLPVSVASLSGLRVLDLTRILAGPWATQILADLGAEVIKVERPGAGDDTRSWGPPDLIDNQGRSRGSAYFNSANRGKKSVAIDIGSRQGQAVLRELVKKSDVVIENFKTGSLAKYGLDYETLRSVKPGLIYCSITGFGHTGPYADRAGYDFLVQAVGGLMSLTGQPDNTPGGEPMKAGVALADVLTGLYATIGILAALRHRDATGKGQHIDLSLLDVQVASLANQAMNYLSSGVSPGRLGNAHPNIVPYQAFATSDGHIILAVGNDGQFQRFCEVAGCKDLALDPRFATNPARVNNRGVLVPILKDVIAKLPMQEWIEKLSAAGVPVSPINDIAATFDDPQVRAREMKISPKTKDGAEVPGVANPLKMSLTPPDCSRAAPALGENSAEVLEDVLGIDERQISELCALGVIEIPTANHDENTEKMP